MITRFWHHIHVGLQIFGLLGHCAWPGDADAGAFMDALRYGDILACEGEPPLLWEENAQGMRWHLRDAQAQVRVIVYGGIEAACFDVASGSRSDQGNEGWLRCEMQDEAGCSYAQPRLIARRPAQ